MRRVAVVGVGQTKFRTRRDDKTHPELTYEAMNKALEHAGLDIKDIQAIAYGTMDPFDGIYLPERWDVTSGGIGKPFMKISTGGTTGMTTGLAAYEHVASGLFDIAMAVCTQRVGECVDAQPVLNTAVCPIYERYSGAGAISVAAIQATVHMHKYGTTEEDLAWVSVKDHKNALKNPNAHIKLDIGVEEVLNSSVVSSIAGRRLYRFAGVDDPKKDIDVAELYSPFTIQEVLELEALGFAKKGEGKNLAREGVTFPDGDMPTNPSGGVLCANPIGATGLVRLAEASLQIMGEASNQVRDVDVSLAHAWGGTLQFHTLMLLSAKKKLKG